MYKSLIVGRHCALPSPTDTCKLKFDYGDSVFVVGICAE